MLILNRVTGSEDIVNDNQIDPRLCKCLLESVDKILNLKKIKDLLGVRFWSLYLLY